MGRNGYPDFSEYVDWGFRQAWAFRQTRSAAGYRFLGSQPLRSDLAAGESVVIPVSTGDELKVFDGKVHRIPSLGLRQHSQ